MSQRATLRWSERARRDLLAIGHYIARDNPKAARAWVERLRLRAREAASSPLAGRRVPELDRQDIREVLVRAYRIICLVRPTGIEVVTVFEGHRLLPKDIEPGALRCC